MERVTLVCPCCHKALKEFFTTGEGFDLIVPCDRCGCGPRFVRAKSNEPEKPATPLTDAVEDRLQRLETREELFTKRIMEIVADIASLTDTVRILLLRIS